MTARLDADALPPLDADHAAGRPVGAAVSGGSDSTALLLLLADRYGADAVRAVTIDHRLRPEAAEEAATVARLCAARGIAHETLAWEGWDGRGNLQDAARRARYRLLSGWAAARGIGTVTLGHTLDDNAETFLMGLTRGAGLDGLSGMRPVFARAGIRFARPLLGAHRADLRKYLTARGVGWIEDASNADPRFDRVRARSVLAQLAPLGVDADRLGLTIANLRRTRAAIEAQLGTWSDAHVRVDRGDLLIAAEAFRALPEDFARRLMNAALRWVSAADYPPRAEKVMQILDRRAGGATLHGCLLTFADPIRVAREPRAAAAAPAAAPGALWDGRWRLTGRDDGEVRALTEAGLAHCPDWRESGLPRASLAASPALWAGETLIAAPLAGHANGCRAELAHPRFEFPGPR